MKLIKKHKEWCEKGELTLTCGLCTELYGSKYYDTLLLFEPTLKEKIQMVNKKLIVAYWGSGLSAKDDTSSFAYTELRQNIVLLICAMHNEL